MKIIVIGGDGFCGWPTSLELASRGNHVMILDNLSRRRIDQEMGSNSLTNIASISERINLANKLVGKIDFIELDVAQDVAHFREIIADFKPDTIIHFGEQRAAPYSMISDLERRYTVDNNILGTHNLCSAVVDIKPDTHIVHLGTMGVYGYSKDFGAIPEGYLNVEIKTTQKDVDILYPANPGSVYHMTKCLDQLIFQFYNKNWGLRVTDLHQGIVWGINTTLTSMDPTLVNRFDYDGIYGTVLNRFLVQSAIGEDLSVYGTGGQTRAFIHISDTARCIRLACENPPSETEKVRIFNQVSETRSVKELAELISKKTRAKISYISNPRKELSENELEVANDGLVSLGFEPVTLSDKLFEDILYLAEFSKLNVKKNKINNSPRW